MDPRIADYIRANRKKYTREVIREQLVKAGHDPSGSTRRGRRSTRPIPTRSSARGSGVGSGSSWSA